MNEYIMYFLLVYFIVTLMCLVSGSIYIILVSGRSVGRIKRDLLYSENISINLRDQLIKTSGQNYNNLKKYQDEIKKLNENLYTLQVLMKNILKDVGFDSQFESPFDMVELSKASKNVFDIEGTEDTVIKEELQTTLEDDFYKVYNKAIEDANMRIKQEIENTKIDFEPSNDINFLNPKLKFTKTNVIYNDNDYVYEWNK